MTRTITVCPECGSPQIVQRVGGVASRTTSRDADYYCEAPDCDAEFNEPATREAESDYGRCGLAHKLAEKGEETGGDVEIEWSGRDERH